MVLTIFFFCFQVKFLTPLDEGEQCEKKVNHAHKDSGIRRTSFVTIGNVGDTRTERQCPGGRDLERESMRFSLVFDLIRNVYQQIRSLGSPPLFQWALLCWTIYFTNMFGYIINNNNFTFRYFLLLNIAPIQKINVTRPS